MAHDFLSYGTYGDLGDRAIHLEDFNAQTPELRPEILGGLSVLNDPYGEDSQNETPKWIQMVG